MVWTARDDDRPDDPIRLRQPEERAPDTGWKDVFRVADRNELARRLAWLAGVCTP